jgi:hypothetical protein
MAAVILGLIAGCDAGSKSAKGFTLPEGNAELGQAAFVQLRCYDCHTVAGVILPVAEESNQVVVRLGGEVARIKTYGELVTSIINPSHRLASGYAATLVATAEGQSRMTVYNDVMTVRQLTDLVAFLQSHYELRPYQQTDYPIY